VLSAATILVRVRGIAEMLFMRRLIAEKRREDRRRRAGGREPVGPGVGVLIDSYAGPYRYVCSLYS
jgi:hypothetical protein